MYHTVRQDPFPALAPFPAPAPSPTAVPASAAAVAAASRVFSNHVRKNTPQMTPKISQEPTAAAAAAAAAAVPAGRGQHAPLPRSVAAGRGQHAPLPRPVAAAAATPGPPGAGTRQPEAQGAVFFLTLLEKTIPKPTKTSLEHEAVRQKRDIRTRFPTTT